MGDDFEQRLAGDWPVESWRDVTVLLAVSGGPDSVALLRAMQALRPASSAGRLIVAHGNHRLRGADSDADAEFVRVLCGELGLIYEIGTLDVAAADASDGLEAAARKARYGFLSTTASQYGARYVVTGHTADDQAETILHRIIRGTGLSGLAGIPRLRPLSELTTVIRPLLWARREDVLAYLTRLGQRSCVDSTNAEVAFTRNRLRNELLPQLARDYNPAVVDALLRLGRLAGEAHDVLLSLANKLHDKAVCPLPGGGWQIDARMLAEEPPYVVREMLIALWQSSGWPMQAMGFAEWQRLAELLQTAPVSPVKYTLPGNITVTWECNSTILRITSAR